MKKLLFLLFILLSFSSVYAESFQIDTVAYNATYFGNEVNQNNIDKAEYIYAAILVKLINNNKNITKIEILKDKNKADIKDENQNIAGYVNYFIDYSSIELSSNFSNPELLIPIRIDLKDIKNLPNKKYYIFIPFTVKGTGNGSVNELNGICIASRVISDAKELIKSYH